MEDKTNTEHLEDQIAMINNIRVMLENNSPTQEILDTLEIWDHDICLEIDFINSEST